MSEFKRRLAKLIDVKSIMTIMLTIVFCLLAATGVISSDQFLTVYAVVVSFFFGTKTGQAQAESEKKGKEDREWRS